jgi:HlyD family secretion protein
LVDEDYTALAENIMAQTSFRATVPKSVPQQPKDSARLVLIAPPSRPHHAIVWLAVLAVALGAAAVWRTGVVRQAGAVAGLRVAKVKIGRLEQTLRVAGTVSVAHPDIIVAPYMVGNRYISGGTSFALVLRKLAPPGSRVRKGDVIAEFDRESMLNRLDDYRDWVRQHQLNLVALEARLGVRRQAYRQAILADKARMEQAALDLKTIPVRSSIRAAQLRLDYEEDRAAYRARVSQSRDFDVSETAALRRSQLDLQQSTLELGRIARNADQMIVHAPLDGLVVLERVYRGGQWGDIREGDEIRPGQPYMQIVDLRSIVLDVKINQVDRERVRLDQPARVHFEAYPALEIPAEIVSVGTFARANGWRASYVREVPLRLKLQAEDERFVPNLSANADIVIQSEDDCKLVPRECVFQEAGAAFVYLKAEDGWQRRKVELGLSNNIMVAVTSGLEAGAEVAAEPPQDLPGP